MDIGNEAQAVIQGMQRNYGGPLFLDDGRCSGWVTVPPGKGRQGQAKASYGSVCAFAIPLNRGNQTNIDTILTNGGWTTQVQATNPFVVKPAPVPSSFRTRLHTALQNAFATSKGPQLLSFSPVIPNFSDLTTPTSVTSAPNAPSISGLGFLPNQYRTR